MGRRARGDGAVSALPAVVAVVALLGLLAGGTPPRAVADVADSPGAPDAAVVRLPFPQDDGTLTPYTFEVGYPLMTLVYDTLLWRDAGGVPRPWLAEALDTSPDGRTVTIRLRDGARWHDGQPLTAADVVFTFGYVAERPHPRFTPSLAAVAGVEAPDAATVVISLRHASPGFADQPLADLPILPAHLWADLPAERVAPEGLPVGSGPYRLAAYDAEDGYRFEANPDYFLGAPRVAAVEVPIVTDFPGTVQALEGGDVDMLPVALPERTADRLAGGLAVQVAQGPVYTGTVLLLNTRRPPFDDPATRRAVAAALDLDRIADAVGAARPADRGYLHPASPWAPEATLHTVDADAARAGLDALGPVRVLAPVNDPTRHEAGRQVARALQRAGVDAEVQAVARDELGRAVGEDGAEADFTAAVWTAPALASYDPDFLYTMFGSDLDRAVLNYTGYASAAFDELAEAVATTVDPGARRAAVDEQLRLLTDDAPVVPLLYADGAFAFRPSVYDGWVFVDGAGILDKRSFLAVDDPAPDGEPEDPATPGPDADNDDESPSSPPRRGLPRPGPLGLVALGLVGVAVLAGAVELIRRR